MFAFSDEDANGRERVFFTLEGQPYVYEWGVDDDFVMAPDDRRPVDGLVVFGYDDQGHPDRQKAYRYAHVDTDQKRGAQVCVSAAFDDGQVQPRGPYVGDGVSRQVEGSALWDQEVWGDFAWASSQRLASPRSEVRLNGRGRNIAFRLCTPSGMLGQSPVTITGLTCGWLPRKMIR